MKCYQIQHLIHLHYQDVIHMKEDYYIKNYINKNLNQNQIFLQHYI